VNDLPLIQFDYKPSKLHIIDNGYTVMINYRSGSFISVGGRRSMHSNNSTFTGLARRRSTARATRWTWPSSVVFHVALRHPAKHENGGFRRREAPTENAALSPYFQGRLHPASRDNSRLTSAGATSKDGLSWRPYLRCARPGRPSLRPLAPTMSVAKTRTKFPTGGPCANDNSLSAASGVRIGHELLRHSPARKEGAAR